jgi:adenylate kinase family enzyme
VTFIIIGVYLLDGFPRSQENIESWNKKMKDVCDTEFVLFFDCDIEKMQERMVERSKTSGRSDDNPETIKLRLETFAKTTKPIIDQYQK